MTTQGKLRAAVLAIHGSLAFCLGLALLYLHATMTNFLFEAVAVVIAILLSAAALLLAALTDWFAAFSMGMKGFHRFTFYLLAGIAFALAGVFLGYYPVVHMQWLVIFALIHELAFGISALVYAFRTHHHPRKRRAIYLFGTTSILFSGAMAGLVRYMDDSSATAVLGWYLCFIGVKMLFFAWNSQHTTAIPGRPWSPKREEPRVPATKPSTAHGIQH